MRQTPFGAVAEIGEQMSDNSAVSEDDVAFRRARANVEDDKALKRAMAQIEIQKLREMTERTRLRRAALNDFTPFMRVILILLFPITLPLYLIAWIINRVRS